MSRLSQCARIQLAHLGPDARLLGVAQVLVIPNDVHSLASSDSVCSQPRCQLAGTHLSAQQLSPAWPLKA